MKKTILLLLASAIVGLWLCVGLSNKAPPKYTITLPYLFERVAAVEGVPLWNELGAYVIPDEDIEQMNTRALLETYTNFPEARIIFLNDFYGSGFSRLKTDAHFGLAQLLEREDLPEALLEYYRELEIFPWEIKYEDSDFFEEEYETVWKLRYLEVLAAQMNLNESDQTQRMLLREMERNYLLYGGASKTPYRGGSVYTWTKHQQEIEKRMSVPIIRP